MRYRGPASFLPETVVSLDYAVVLCDGTLSATRRGVLQELQKGVFCLQPGDAIILHGGRSTALHVRALLLEPTVLEKVALELRATTGTIADSSTNELGLYEAVEAVWSGESARAVQSAFRELVRVLLKQELGLSKQVRSVSSPGLQRAKALILSSAESELTLDAISAEVGLSKAYLVRAFRQTFGMTPCAYLMHVRVARARQLLRRGWRPIDVASELGFCDQSHLHRRFLKMTGVTPRAYVRATAPALLRSSLDRVENKTANEAGVTLPHDGIEDCPGAPEGPSALKKSAN